MASNRLYPCQHCGDARLNESNGKYHVECTCGHAWKALPIWFDAEADAVKAWNKIAFDW